MGWIIRRMYRAALVGMLEATPILKRFLFRLDLLTFHNWRIKTTVIIYVKLIDNVSLVIIKNTVITRKKILKN